MKNNNITLNEKKSMSMKSKKAIMGSIFIAPALIFIFIFLLLPAILAFIYSFQNYNMLKPHAKVFVALQNYMEILKDPAFYKVLKNTVYFAAIVVPAQSAVALLLALIVKPSHLRLTRWSTTIPFTKLSASLANIVTLELK